MKAGEESVAHRSAGGTGTGHTDTGSFAVSENTGRARTPGDHDRPAVWSGQPEPSYLRDMYRPGMVMEQWNRRHAVMTAMLSDGDGAESQPDPCGMRRAKRRWCVFPPPDSSWSLFRPENAGGRRRATEGDRKIPDSASSPAVTACRWHPSVKMR